MNFLKTTRFHFINGHKDTVIESNEILFTKTKIKFRGHFYSVDSSYFEILDDGTSIYHHNCNAENE